MALMHVLIDMEKNGIKLDPTGAYDIDQRSNS